MDFLLRHIYVAITTATITMTIDANVVPCNCSPGDDWVGTAEPPAVSAAAVPVAPDVSCPLNPCGGILDDPDAGGGVAIVASVFGGLLVDKEDVAALGVA
jgi:hypothetical protein